MQERDDSQVHLPVLLGESMGALQPERGGLFVDATLGLGGHSEAILNSSADVRVIGIDQDHAALKRAKERLAKFGSRITFIHSNFSAISALVERASADGIFADLGVSSLQLDDVRRGFSFRSEAPLDMRMDTATGETAAELLLTLGEKEIADIIYRFGEERFSRRIARRIVERRVAGQPITTTSELADLVSRTVPHKRTDRIHPATRTFQALRIAVNRELDILDQFIKDAVDTLKTNGVLAIITFHSLEDRIVKHAFQRLSGRCACPPRIPKCICGAEKLVEIMTRRPIVPTESEINANPRSRSAKLRACRKLR